MKNFRLDILPQNPLSIVLLQLLEVLWKGCSHFYPHNILNLLFPTWRPHCVLCLVLLEKGTVNEALAQALYALVLITQSLLEL